MAKPIFFDTKFSLYCQLARMVMHENDIDFDSCYVDLPNGEQLEPWFARVNPKMIIPALKMDDGNVICDSREIMRVMDKQCPDHQQEAVEKIMDIAYSCELGWFSTVAMQKKIWLWRLLQNSGVMEKMVASKIKQYADENPDLRRVYLDKQAVSVKDVSASVNANRKEPIQICLDKLALKVEAAKDDEWVTGKVFTRADALIAIYVQWVKWQISWYPGALSLAPSLIEFHKKVMNRRSYAKTLDVDCQWVGFYWRDRLVPLQNAIYATMAAVPLALLGWASVGSIAA